MGPPPTTTTTTTMASQLPLTARKSLKDAEPQNAAVIKKLEDATGTTGWTFEADGAAIHEALKNDDMYKEAFVEKITAKKIKFVVTSQGPAYCPGETSFPEGVLLVTIHQEKPWVNVNQTGNKIESQL